MYRDRRQDVAPEIERNYAAPKQNQFRPSNQLLLIFPPFPVRHPGADHGSYKVANMKFPHLSPCLILANCSARRHAKVGPTTPPSTGSSEMPPGKSSMSLGDSYTTAKRAHVSAVNSAGRLWGIIFAVRINLIFAISIWPLFA